MLDYKAEIDAKYGDGKIVPTAQTGLTFSQLHKLFLIGRGGDRSKKTKYLYNLALSRIYKFWGDVEPGRLIESDMIEFRRWLVDKEGKSNASCYLRSLAAIINWGVEKHHLLYSPITKDVKINVPTKPIIKYSDDQIKAVLKAAGPDVEAHFRFLLLSGFRTDEACDLKWDHIDFGNRNLHVFNAKENRYDFIPMDRDLIRFLKKCPKTFAPYVLRYRSRHTLSHALEDIRETLSLDPRLKVHTLRKNFISNIVNSGASESMLMHLARHRSIATTHKYYTAFDVESTRKALQNSRKKR